MLSFCFICIELCDVSGFVGVGDAVFEHKLDRVWNVMAHAQKPDFVFRGETDDSI